MSCLDEDTVLSFVDGILRPEERAAAERHVADCIACSDLVAATAGASPARLAQIGFSAPSAPRPSLPAGATVGRYVILNLVGRGGMGEVYAAYDPQLDRRVALKLIDERAIGDEAATAGRQRLLREAKAIAKLSHPNVVVVHDAGAIDDGVNGTRVFLAMEFVDGETLGAWLAAAPRGWRVIRDAFAAAGEGLSAAHRAGLVHRDFKPQNVMVARNGTVRVMDFGLATDADGAAAEAELDAAAAPDDPLRTPALSRTGMLLGTPLYMAPEQFKSRRTDARSDQFSFCVALYEALYGQHPFPAEGLSALAKAVKAGQVRQPPQKANVPAFLRRVVMRGMAVDPGGRWSSMRALLDALEHEPARQRRRAGLVLAAVALVAGAIGAQRFLMRGEGPCRRGGDKLADVWELGAGARRDAVQRAFLATGRSFAAATWTRVAALLDAYGRRWTGAYTDACEATQLRGDQSAEVLDLRMTCLEGPRGALRALTDVLARADGKVLTEAVNAAQALPPIERCADVAQLRSAVPLPADPATRDGVARVRRDLDEVRALFATGRCSDAGAKIDGVVTRARGLRYAPLLAESLLAQALLAERLGTLETTVKTCESAVSEALKGRRDDLAVDAASMLVAFEGYYQAHYENAERWYQLAAALLERLGPGHERATAWLAQGRAAYYVRQGRYRESLAEAEVALALKQKVLPADHPDIALTWAGISDARERLGDAPGALEAADRAIAIQRHAYGSDNPLLAFPLGNRGEALAMLGRHAEAERDLRESVDKWTEQVGPDNAFVAYPLTALGKTLAATGRARDAVPVLERALRIREAGEHNPEPLAETRFALARALATAGTDATRSRALATAARDSYRGMSGHGGEATAIDRWLTAGAR